MCQVADHGVHVSAVAWQLLGSDGEQHLGRAILRVGAAAEGIQISDGFPLQPGAELLPLQGKVAQLACHQPSLEHAVQLHPQLLRPGSGRTLDAGVVAQHQNGISGHIVQRTGKFRVDQGHISVGSGVTQPVLVFFQVLGQGGHQRLVDIFVPPLPGDQIAQVPAQPLRSTAVAVGERFADGQ